MSPSRGLRPATSLWLPWLFWWPLPTWRASGGCPVLGSHRPLPALAFHPPAPCGKISPGSTRRSASPRSESGVRGGQRDAPMAEYTVAVVICAYTMERLDAIERAVASIHDQRRPANELILVIDHNP